MKAFKVTMVFIDFDGLGIDSVKDEINNVRFPNDCISPQVMDIEERDIGLWHDNHPLNKRDPEHKEWRELFKKDG